MNKAYRIHYQCLRTAGQDVYKRQVQTVLGAAEMVKCTNQSPNDLKDDVCTPGGTTIEAVCSLEQNRFISTVIAAVTACFEKSQRM